MDHAVMLDTNVYRSLADESFNTLLDQEQRRRVTPYVDPLVIMELLAHLADPQDAAFTSCRRALRRIDARCPPPRGDGRLGGLINDPESQVVRMITGRSLPGGKEFSAFLGAVCHTVATTPLDKPLMLDEGDLRYIRDHVETTEARFANQLREHRKLVLAMLAQEGDAQKQRTARAVAMREFETSGLFRTALAESIVRGAFEDAGLKLPEPPPPVVVQWVRKALAVGIEFYARMLRMVIYDNANLDASRTRNLMWDQRIAFYIGQRLEGGQIWFISNDRAFAAAAASVGYGHRVRSLTKYQSWLAARRRGLRRPRR